MYFYEPSAYFTYVRRIPPFFHGKRKRKGWITKKLSFLIKSFIFYTLKRFLQSSYLCDAILFLSHSVAVSFPTKVISIGISNPIAILLFIFTPVTLQLAYYPGKQRNLLKPCLGKEAHVQELLLF